MCNKIGIYTILGIFISLLKKVEIKQEDLEVEAWSLSFFLS